MSKTGTSSDNDSLPTSIKFADFPTARVMLGDLCADVYNITSITPRDPISEPATILLLGFGLAGLAGLGRKKFRKS